MVQGQRTPRFLAVASSLAALLAVLPLVYLLVRVGQAPVEDLAATLLSRRLGLLTLRTLGLGAGVVAATLAIALPYAWLVVRTDLPGRRLWALLGALPLVFPSYVAAFALVAFFGPRGHLQSWLEPFGVERLPAWVYGFDGALVALSLFTYPYVFLLLVAALRNLDPAVEENARVLGHPPIRVFWHVVLPQLKGPLAGGAGLVALYVLSDFGAVSITRFNTFTLSIYTAYGALFDRSRAAALALVLVLLTAGVVLVQAWIQRGQRASRRRPFRRVARQPLGRWRLPAVGFLTLISLVSLVVPMGIIGHWVVLAWRLGGPLPAAWQAALNSLGVSLLAAVASTLLALPVALWAVRHPGPGSRWTERLAQSGFALPGLVIALTLVFFATRNAMALYQTVTLLLAAYVIRFLPQALTACRGAIAAVSPRFEEAARGLGHSRWSVARTVTLPLVAPGLLAGAGLVFLTTMKELPATLILRPTGFDTLATRTWSATAEGIYSQAALPAAGLLLVSILPVYWLVIRPVLEGGRGS